MRFFTQRVVTPCCSATSLSESPHEIGRATIWSVHVASTLSASQFSIPGNELWLAPFVHTTIAKDPPCAEVAPLPVDDEAPELVAGVSGKAAPNRGCVATETPDERDAFGEQILSIEVAEFGEATALDRSLTERLDIANVVQGELLVEHRLAG